MSYLVLGLAIVVALLAVLVVGLLRSHAVIVRALHDNGIVLDPDRADDTIARASHAAPFLTQPGVPEPRTGGGMRAVDIVGTTPSGSVKTVAVRQRDHATLLAFLTTGCTTCAGFWHDFADGVEMPPDLRLVVVTRGEDDESPAEVARLAGPGVQVVMSSDAWDDYSIPVAPYFALVDGRSGLVVGEGAAARWADVLTLLSRALADAGHDSSGRLTRRDLFTRGARPNRADRELEEAGINPGDPRLYHDDLPVVDPETRGGPS